MKTFTAKPADIQRAWHLIDASDLILGRMASRLSLVLQGKHKPIYTPHIDCGDHVVVINAEKIRVTGKKAEQKRYYHHTGYPGGLRVTTYEQMMEAKPEQIIRLAVRRMLPKNKLARKMLTKLHIYAGANHPHSAQQPQPLELT